MVCLFSSDERWIGCLRVSVFPKGFGKVDGGPALRDAWCVMVVGQVAVNCGILIWQKPTREKNGHFTGLL
jgi:hypothetical protein